ncbi:MAG: lasso RiPP family leader peptide-containing protein [Vicinamibacterales bacterium]
MEQKREKPSDATERAPERGAKKPYATPVLTEYGNVAKLTQSGAGSIADTPGSQRKTCL